MNQPLSVDGVIVEWGDRLFYPGNRMVKQTPEPRLRMRRAAALRQRIHSTVVKRAPQVMVKVTGGGRGMKAIFAHFRYISKHGRLELENDQGSTIRGKEALRDLAEEWRLGGSYLRDESHRREAFNIILSMPRGTNPEGVLLAARAFAKAEFADHLYVMVLHDHQANPHVHLSVRAESRDGKRLNPRKADLHRWRETFAEKLREIGIEAEASRQPSRGQSAAYEALWRIKARDDGRLMHSDRPGQRRGTAAASSRAHAVDAWRHIAEALSRSPNPADRSLAVSIVNFVGDMPYVKEQSRVAKGLELPAGSRAASADRSATR